MKKFVLKNGETRFQKAETRFQKAETRFQNAKTALSRIFFARTGMDTAHKKSLGLLNFGPQKAFLDLYGQIISVTNKSFKI